MGKANTSVNQWLRDNHRFASLYNGYVFGGRQIMREVASAASCDEELAARPVVPLQHQRLMT